MQIINTNTGQEKEIKVVPEMLNLLGCNKENFVNLLKKMNYIITKKDEEFYFKYNPSKKRRSFNKKIISKENPFNILKNLDLNR